MPTETTKVLRFDRQPETRVQELLEAALMVFAEKGYRNARLDDVAEAAGVTKGAIYHYFDTKEALLVAVIDHFRALAFDRAEAVLEDTSLSVSTRLSMVLRKVFWRREDDTGDRLLAMLIRSAAIEVPQVHDRWLRDGPLRLWAMLTTLIDEGKATGEFRKDADGDVAARMIVSGLMLQRMWQQHAADIPGLPIESDRLIDSAVELLLASLRPVYALSSLPVSR